MVFLFCYKQIKLYNICMFNMDKMFGKKPKQEDAVKMIEEVVGEIEPEKTIEYYEEKKQELKELYTERSGEVVKHQNKKDRIDDISPDEPLNTKETFFNILKNKAESVIENTQPYFQDTFRKGEQYIKIALFSAGAFAAQEGNAQSIENAQSLKDHIIESTEIKYDSIMQKIDSETYHFPQSFKGSELAFMNITKEVDSNINSINRLKMNIPESKIETGLILKNLAMKYNHRMSYFDNTEKNSGKDSSYDLNDFLYNVEILESKEDNITPTENFREFTASGKTKQEALLSVMSEMQNQIEVLRIASANTEESINNENKSSYSSNYLNIIRVQSLEYYDSVEITDIENNGGEVYINSNPEIQDGYTITIKVNFGELQQ